MAVESKSVRRSVVLPSQVARQVTALAKNRGLSANRVLLDLIETGLHSKEEEKRKFFQMAERLRTSTDMDEQLRIKKDLARLTFGE